MNVVFPALWDHRAAPQAVAMTLLPPFLAGYEETLMRLAAILAKHFADSRIVGTGKAAFLCFWGDNVTGHCQWLTRLLLGSVC